MANDKEEWEEDLSVEDYISSFKTIIPNQLAYVKANDWTKEPLRTLRASQYRIQEGFLSQANDHAVMLQTIATDIDSNRVKEWAEVLTEFHKIFEERCLRYFEEENWSTYLEQGKTADDVDKEASLQTEIAKALAKSKSKIRKLNFGETKMINIGLVGNVKAPLMMKDVIENKFPAVKEFIEKRFADEGRERYVSGNGDVSREGKGSAANKSVTRGTNKKSKGK